jgi:hypothetical protein
MRQYVLSTGAELDLNEIWEYIAQDNLDAADRWIKKLFDAFETLARAPGMGHKREDLTAFPVLFWPVGVTRSFIGCTGSVSKSLPSPRVLGTSHPS